MRATVRGALLVALAVVGACSGGDDGADDGSELGSTSSIAPPSPPEVPAPSPAGTGVVIIGANGTPSSFAVTSCALELTDDDTGELLRITGQGTSSSDVPFQVEVARSSTAGAAETFTDLITYTDTARILQVQRFEAAGEVSDLRDPDARGTLLRTRADGLSAVGIAGPPGTGEKGPGLVGLALDATCEDGR